MAVYTVSCTETKLILDTDAGVLKITRNARIGLQLPAETVIPLDQITSIENQYMDFGLAIRGSGSLKVIYPGCPAGGDMLLGYTTHENMVQYKAKALDSLNELLAALQPYIDANNAK